MIVTLQSGAIAPDIRADGESTLINEKPALFCYEGEFESADGPVTITAEDLQRIADNYNGRLQRLGATPRMGDCPPVQLDHSRSSRDTVGRVVGPLEVKPWEGRAALFGSLRFLGQDNIEKANDGRWTHLSIGADLEEGTLLEMTVTPFPAAANASLLARFGGNAMDPKLLKYLMETETLPEDEAKVKLEKMTDEEIEELRKKAKMTAKPKRKTRTAKMAESDGQKSDDDKTDMGCGSKKKLEDDDEDENTSLSDDNDDDDTTNMSNDDDNNTNMSDDNEDDDSTNMSDDNEDSTDMSNGGEDDDEDEEKQKSELTARLKGFKKKSIELTRKMQTAHVGNRIMRLRAQGKISPAEIKKIDMAQLCAENKATIDAVLKTYENRQPVIHMGQYGSIQGVDNQEMEKIAKMRALEKETMANMSFTSKALGVKLAAETNEYTQDTNRVAEPVEMGDSNEENAWADIVRAVEDGRHDEGKAMFRKACRMSAGDVGASPDDLAELTAAISDLETEFGTVVQLAGKRLGIQL